MKPYKVHIFILIIIPVFLSGTFSKIFPQKKKSKSKVEINYDQYPFDTSKTYNGKYPGHDIIYIYKALQDKPKKDEYETNVQFQERFGRWKSKTLYGHVTGSDLIAVKLYPENLTLKFDAESTKMKVSANYRGNIVIIETNKDLKPSSGKTAMGVKFAYTRSVSSCFELSLSNSKYLDLEHDIAEFKVPSDIAKNNTFWEIYLVGYLDEPFAEEESEYHTPRLDERYESYDKYYRIGFRYNYIWIYDRITDTTILKTLL